MKVLNKSLLILVSIFNFWTCNSGENITGSFPKSVTVFGVKILATETTGDAKVLHAAKVLAQYLDNDENGKVEKRTIKSNMGGTMRLGSYPCVIKKESLAHKIYSEKKIYTKKFT